jgi:hypothetical protein
LQKQYGFFFILLQKLNIMKSIITAIVFTILTSSNVSAGWHIILNYHTPKSDEYQKIWIQNKIIRQSSLDFDIIFDQNLQTITFISHKIKSYYTAKISEFNNEMPKAFETGIEQALANIPKNKKDSIFRLFNFRNSQTTMQKVPLIRFDKTNVSEEISGFMSSKFEVFSNKKLVEYVWITDDKLLSSSIDYEQYYSILQSVYVHKKNSFLNAAEYFSFFNDKFPTKIIEINPKDTENPFFSQEVRFAQQEEFLPEAFDVPKNYQTLDVYSFFQFFIADQIQNLFSE